MIRAVTPAPLLDLVDLCKRAGMLRRRDHLRVAFLQAARSESVGFHLGAELVAAALLYPLGVDAELVAIYELAFIVTPAARPHMLAIARAARSTRRGLAKDRVRVRAWCARENHAGRRLALLSGLRPVGLAGSMKRYEWTPHDQLRDGARRQALRRRRQRGAATAATGGATEPAGNDDRGGEVGAGQPGAER